MDLVVQPAEPGAQLLADLRVEAAERLVQEQHLGPRRQGPRQRHPLPLAAGELRGIARGISGELHQVQQLVDPGADLGPRQLAHLQPERDVVADGHVPEQGIVLEDETDAPPLDRDGRGVLAGQLDRAASRRSPGRR